MLNNVWYGLLGFKCLVKVQTKYESNFNGIHRRLVFFLAARQKICYSKQNKDVPKTIYAVQQ